MKRPSPSPDNNEFDHDGPNKCRSAAFVGPAINSQPPPPDDQPVFRSMPIVDRPSPIGGGGSSGIIDRGIREPIFSKSLGFSPPDHKAMYEHSDIRKDVEAGRTGEEEEYGEEIDDADSKEGEKPPSNWSVKGKLPPVPTYYPLEKSSRYVMSTSVEEIANNISECCRVMSVHAQYNVNEDVPVSCYLFVFVFLRWRE